MLGVFRGKHRVAAHPERQLLIANCVFAGLQLLEAAGRHVGEARAILGAELLRVVGYEQNISIAL